MQPFQCMEVSLPQAKVKAHPLLLVSGKPQRMSTIKDACERLDEGLEGSGDGKEHAMRAVRAPNNRAPWAACHTAYGTAA